MMVRPHTPSTALCLTLPFFFFIIATLTHATSFQQSEATEAKNTIPVTRTVSEGGQVVSNNFRALVDWMRSNGGRVDDRLAIGIDQEGGRGLMATEDIRAGSELFFTPWSLVIGTIGDTHQTNSDHCATLNDYSDQVRAGKDSFWYPYLSMDKSLDTRIPTLWQETAMKELQGLLPDASQTSITKWYSESCCRGIPFDDLDAASKQALIAAITRSAGMRFVPVFDLMNHDHGKMNVRSEATLEGNIVYAAVDIPKGDAIYTSYRSGNGASSEIFRRYGFIESNPQQWMWTDTNTHRLEWFLRLSTDVIILRPSEFMTSQMGVANPPLSDISATAKYQYQYNLTREELITFAESAKKLLQSLPTTIEQDFKILRELTAKEASSSSSSSGSNEAFLDTLLQDTTSAVGFRIAFKEAVQQALDTALATLAIVMKESTRRTDL